MKRRISTLREREFDLLIIGGGIHGASVARDASLRGLTVALVDQGDFGSGTSANSHKIIHGGLRYLQHADFKRMRESIRERSALLRIAPHLVSPLPILVPTYRHWNQGKLAMYLAFRLNDMISFDRNRFLQPEKAIVRGRIISKAECLKLCPGLDNRELTGGAIFYDGQVYNPERLTLSVLWSASLAGAALANYVRVSGFMEDHNKIAGVEAVDVLEKECLKIRAKVVVNCSGPWIDQVLQSLRQPMRSRAVHLLKAVVLVTKQLVCDVAVAVPGSASYEDVGVVVNKGHRYYVITPWRNTSLIGTFQVPHKGDADNLRVTEDEMSNFIGEFNSAFPAAHVKREDVRFVYAGLLPQADTNGVTSDIQLLKNYQILDHDQEGRLKGLVSVIGVKYTTARDVAEKVTNLVLRKLGRRYVPSRTDSIPVYGGDIRPSDSMLACDIEKQSNGVRIEVLQHLIQTYGSQYSEILRYGVTDPDLMRPVAPGLSVTKAEIVNGVRAEMAQKLEDIIFRRTELGTAGYPGDACLETCAEIVATELGWSERRTRSEIEETRAVFEKMGCVEWKAHNVCVS